MGDLEEESPSDDDNITEIENELYSMFYYHSVSDGIPDDLAKKYNVDVDDFGATISLKDPINDRVVEDIDDDNEELNSLPECNSSTPYTERYIDGRCNKRDKSTADVEDEISDLVKLPTKTNRVGSKGKSRYFEELVVTCSSTGEELVNTKKCDGSNKLSSPKNVTLKKSYQSKPLGSTRSNKSIKKSNKSKVSFTQRDDEVIDLTDVSSERRRKMTNKANKKPVVYVISDTDSNNSSSEESDSYSSSGSDNVGVLDSIVLNTTVPFDEDSCDSSVINTNYNWKLTSSPEGWTKSMRRYYNKPSKTLLTFDKETILQRMRSDASADWSICRADYLKIRGPRRMRCLRCQQEGHVKANCTKIFSCHMCGTPGHISHKCPDKICLKCGSKQWQSFVTECRKCTDENSPICNVCGVQGHIAKLCTNAWRTFVKVNNADKKEGPKYCCHCGKSGHVYEDCTRLLGVKQNHKHKGMIIKKNASLKKNKGKKRKTAISESNIHQGHHTVFPSHKKVKYRDSERNINPGVTKFIRLMSKTTSNEKLKNRKLSKRIKMLRNSKKKNKLNQRRSTPFS